MKEYKYDVALSFAGEQRDYVKEVAGFLTAHSVKVFYDYDYLIDIWGRQLQEYLEDVYTNQARYCVMFISKEYASKEWTRCESAAATRTMIKKNAKNQIYLLPVRFDDTNITGVPDSIAYLDAHSYKPDELGRIIMEKVESPYNKLEDDLKEYIDAYFKQFREDDVAVQTPQLLLMLLGYSGCALKGILRAYKVYEPVFEKLKSIDEGYHGPERRTYQEENWDSFMKLLDHAEEVRTQKTYEETITANILCNAIFEYGDGTTVKWLKKHLGEDEFSTIKSFVLSGRIPSIVI